MKSKTIYKYRLTALLIIFLLIFITAAGDLFHNHHTLNDNDGSCAVHIYQMNYVGSVVVITIPQAGYCVLKYYIPASTDTYYSEIYQDIHGRAPPLCLI